MRKLITLGLVLGLLTGFGTKSYGQAAGDYVFTQATDTLWATVGNWSISDGAGNLSAATTTPTATTNVWIPTGKRMGTVAATTTATGAITSGSTTLTLTTIPTNNLVGMAIRNKQSGINGSNFGITPGTYITAVNGAVLTLSQPATSTAPSLSIDFYPACKSLNISGYIGISSALVVYGDITVNSGGILTHGADLYCANINNYGTFKGNQNYGSSSKSLYFGYNGAAPGTGDYILTNDGVFGDSQIRVPINGNTAGIRVIYSNQASNITIKPSSSTVSGYTFNIAQLIPTNYIKTTANTNLYIKENMSLLLRNGIGLSIQNNDSCIGTTRTCTIDPGISVYLGYNFHANRGVPTYPQGNFVYNVYGTLDLGTYATGSNTLTAGTANTTDFDLCLTNYPGNAGSLTFNLGDGTQSNPGKLILGSNIKFIKQSTQALNINFKTYSEVVVMGNYGWQMNFQLLNDNVPALYMFPSSFYNLTYNGTKAILPIKPTVKGTFTNTLNGYGGTTNWLASVTGTAISSSLYVATLPQGSIMYTGTGYYYVPVVRALYNFPTSTTILTRTSVPTNDTISAYIKAGQYANGTNISSYSLVNSITSNTVTLGTSTTNSSSAASNIAVTFTGIQGTSIPTGTGTTSSPTFDGLQPLIYLGGADFATPTISPNAVYSPNMSNVLVYSNEQRQIIVTGTTQGSSIELYSINGVKLASIKTSSDNAVINNIQQGIYLVKVGSSVSKVIVK